jgi:S1-C subfamily serine protease
VYGVDAPRDRLPGIYRFGVLVEKAEGPAAAAGVRAGDVLVLADGNAFQDLDGFADYFARKKAGDQVRLGVVRESKLVELQVTLGAR